MQDKYIEFALKLAHNFKLNNNCVLSTIFYRLASGI